MAIPRPLLILFSLSNPEGIAEASEQVVILLIKLLEDLYQTILVEILGVFSNAKLRLTYLISYS